MVERDMYGTRDAASNWECDGQDHLEQWSTKLEQSSKSSFLHGNNNIPGRTRRGLRGHRANIPSSSTSWQECTSSKTRIISQGSTESINALTKKSALETERGWCTSMTQDM